MYLGIIKSFTPVVLLFLWGKCECHMFNRQSNKKTQRVFVCSFYWTGTERYIPHIA